MRAMATCVQAPARLLQYGRAGSCCGPKPHRGIFSHSLRRAMVRLGVVASLLAVSGEGAVASLQQRPSFPHDVVFVLDNSASMQKVDPQLRLREVVARFMTTGDSDTRVGVVLFDKGVRLALPLTFGDRAATQQLGMLLSGLNYRGVLSDLPGGLERAVYELKRRGRDQAAKSVFLVTDGILDLGAGVNADNVLAWVTGKLAAQAAAEGIGVFGLAMSERANYRLFQSLAQVTAADYFRALDVDEIAPIIEQVMERVRDKMRPAPADALPTPSTAAPHSATIEQAPEQAPESSPAAAAEPSRASPADEPRLSLPLDARAIWPDLVVAAGMPSRSFMWLGGAVSVTLLAVVALVVWAVLQLGREGQALRAVRTPEPPSQELVPKAFLYDLSGATASELHEVSKKVTVIGRFTSPATGDPAAGHLLLNDPHISRRHAIIEYTHQGFWLVDQRSLNGTYVGGERVLEAVCLKHNDRITLGNLEFEFHIAAMDEAAETVLVRA